METKELMKTWIMPDKLSLDRLNSFKPLKNAARARVGVLGCKRYVAKASWGVGPLQDDIIHNECVCDEFLRAGGLNVPPSKEYKVDFGRGPESVRLSAYIEGHKNDKDSFEYLSVERARAVRMAYPLLSFARKWQAFEGDNVIWKDEEPWFVNNSVAFKFGIDHQERKNWLKGGPNDPHLGYSNILNHYDRDWNMCLSMSLFDRFAMKVDAASYNYGELVSKLPEDYASNLTPIAQEWDEWKLTDSWPQASSVYSKPNMYLLRYASLHSARDYRGFYNNLTELLYIEMVIRKQPIYVKRVADGGDSKIYLSKAEAEASGVETVEKQGKHFIALFKRGWYGKYVKAYIDDKTHLRLSQSDINRTAEWVAKLAALKKEPKREQYKLYKNLVNVGYNKVGGINLSLESDYDYIGIDIGASNIHTNEGHHRDDTPSTNIYQKNAVYCANYSNGIYDSGTVDDVSCIFTWELKKLAREIWVLLVRPFNRHLYYTFRGLDKVLMIKGRDNGDFMLTVVDTQNNRVFSEQVTRADIWRLYHFFDTAAKRYPPVGLPTREQMESDPLLVEAFD